MSVRIIACHITTKMMWQCYLPLIASLFSVLCLLSHSGLHVQPALPTNQVPFAWSKKIRQPERQISHTQPCQRCGYNIASLKFSCGNECRVAWRLCDTKTAAEHHRC